MQRRQIPFTNLELVRFDTLDEAKGVAGSLPHPAPEEIPELYTRSQAFFDSSVYESLKKLIDSEPFTPGRVLMSRRQLGEAALEMAEISHP